jgi:zinc D-Ala-D-Ala dipeptidase
VIAPPRAPRCLATLLGLALAAAALPGCASRTSERLAAHRLEALRSEALRALPPAEEGDFLPSDLVEPVLLDPTLQLDVRYATDRNFLGWAVYPEARVFLQRPVAEAVVRAHRALQAEGYGLVLHDGYRPWYVTKVFWDATPPAQRHYVADPAAGSRHNRGGAVDVSLYDRATGRPVPMPSEYDDFSERAHPDYPGGTAAERDARDLLRRTMAAEGCTVYEHEWWHYDCDGWQRYRIENRPFKDLRAR